MLNAEIPFAVGLITTKLPEQIVALLTVIVGVVFTVMLAMAVFELAQPLVPVPVIEYVLLLAGLTVKFPLLILKEFIPTAVGVITTELPEQIVALLTEMLGVVFTVIDETAVFELTQPFVPVPVTE